MTHSPLEASPLFHIGPVPISDFVIVTWGIMAVLFLFALTVTRRLSLTPGKGQTTLEILVGAIDGQIRDTMQVDPAPYRALIGTIFVFVLLANWSSLIPGVEPPTSHLETDTRSG
jgi:F-type H+-transporting ATPase subunit a